jgi:hypothetical protein
MVQKGTEMVTREGSELAPPSSNLAKISPEAIQETKQSIALLQNMVEEVLTRDIDYGKVSGVPQEFLWDPGASMIIAAFNSYPGERRILVFEDNKEKIVACVEVPLVSRATQRVVATGVGAASTLETKHKYRWVKDPGEWGYDAEAIKTLKTKTPDGVKLYRVLNPEHSDLVNTILKMASKRAEVDAAQALPGVASVLRKMFTGYKEKGKKGTGDDKWKWFWGQVRMLGFTPDEAHKELNAASMEDWLDTGQTLEQAIEMLRGKAQQKSELKVEVKTPPGSLAVEEPPLDKRHRLWQEVQSKMQVKPKAAPASIKAWFAKNFNVEIDPARLELEAPQEEFTDSMLESFLNTLIVFHESKKGPK